MKVKEKKEKCEYILVAFKVLVYASDKKVAAYLGERDLMVSRFSQELQQIPTLGDIMRLASQRYEDSLASKKTDPALLKAETDHKTRQSL
jgi:hypothetical protein